MNGNIQLNQQTYELNNNVIESVCSIVSEQWRQLGGDFKVLDNIKNEWTSRTMQKLNLQVPQNQQTSAVRVAREKKEAQNSLDETLRMFGIIVDEDDRKVKKGSEASEGSESSSLSSGLESASDNEGEAKQESNSGSELESNSSSSASGSESGSGSSYSSSSDDGLGTESDGEATMMVTPIIARDKCLCQYNYISSRRSKKGGTTINVSLAHFEINGIPRVAKSGQIYYE